MHSYSLAVALFDFVPVVVTALGLSLLARAIAQRHHALAAAAWGAALLVPFGGACKASSKLIVALSGESIGWLESLLFIALAPGFVTLAYSLHHARRAWQGGVAPDQAAYSRPRLLLWLALPLAGAVAAATLCPYTRAWFFWLLAVTTAANAALLAQAFLAARHAGLRGRVPACLAYNFCATLALGGLARLPPGEATAWLQEGVNLSAQAALAYAFWQLGRRMTTANGDAAS